MEYSLSTLNNKSNFSSLNLNETINTLNLIGFEVDEVSFEKSNSYAQDIRFLLKSPADRDDLFLENLFLSELAVIFLLELYELWSSLKQKYSFVLKQKYLNYRPFEIQNIEGTCPEIIKYIIKIDNVSNVSSPRWIEKKLLKRGIKPKNTFEDVLELISLEWGYRFKIYSADKQNSTERFSLEHSTTAFELNGSEIYSTSGTIILKNQFNEIKSVLGLDCETKEFYNSIYIEDSFYDIHENKLNLTANNTKLSFRGLRKNYLSNFKYAVQRLLSLVEILKIGDISKTIHVFNTHNKKLKDYRLLKLEKQLLTNVLNLEKIDSTLFNKSGLKVISETNKDLYIQIPTFRNDLTREIDLVEEYSRFIGYANFPEILPGKELKYYSNSQKNIEHIKTFFVNYNFNEVYTNPLQDNNLGEENSLKLFNPLNGELSCLREDIVSSLLRILETNLNANIETNNLFEIGRVFKLKNGKIIEQEKLAGIFQDSLNKSNDLDWFVKKGFVENFLSYFGYKTILVEKWQNPFASFHPNKSIIIKDGNKVLGYFGEINPKLKTFKQLKSLTYLFEFNLIHFKAWRLNSRIPLYKVSSKYPIIQKDICVLISKNENFYNLKQSIEKNLSDLKSINFFDIYVDKKTITSNIKLGIRLEFQSINGTLTNETIEEKILSLREILAKQFNAIFQD
jgi:phenylalanyl-tRNA synthetase beta chain